MEPTVIAALAAWVQIKLAERHRLEDREKTAVDAVCNAANETRLYVRRVKPPRGIGDEEPNRDREDQLSRLWMAAHNALFQVDVDLADRCCLKSGYWSDPDEWSPAQIEAARINLDKICDDASAFRETVS